MLSAFKVIVYVFPLVPIGMWAFYLIPRHLPGIEVGFRFEWAAALSTAFHKEIRQWFYLTFIFTPPTNFSSSFVVFSRYQVAALLDEVHKGIFDKLFQLTHPIP
jgi:hypothetical protein